MRLGIGSTFEMLLVTVALSLVVLRQRVGNEVVPAGPEVWPGVARRRKKMATEVVSLTSVLSDPEKQHESWLRCD
ncbi:hypothetical protein DL764_001951 [Monosporascus ibericus]|uniref:Secreted protein n=1 Tax=Monosporascus ibericus TaxID=155417 RepID=A0A4Q4TP64_9PEZI|nr:hypothetical protein DL764_001951 [Monosporascus ibericus]